MNVDSNTIQVPSYRNSKFQTKPLNVFYKLHRWDVYLVSLSIPLLQMSVCVNKIPCCSSPDLSLGSVAFAETFIDSVVHIKDGWDSQHVVLTTQIPSNLSWPVSHSSFSVHMLGMHVTCGCNGMFVVHPKLAFFMFATA